MITLDCGMNNGRVVLGGWRGVNAPIAAELRLRAVVAELVRAGRGLGIGCCVGADSFLLAVAAQEIRAGRLDANAATCFAAFGPKGAGAWSGSARSYVDAWCARGWKTVWWAGGGSGVPLVARLAGRTRAAVRWAGGGAAGSGAVLFLGPAGLPAGSGSALLARTAAAAGLPVVAFAPAGTVLAPATESPGCWRPAAVKGLWAAAQRWEAL